MIGLHTNIRDIGDFSGINMMWRWDNNLAKCGKGNIECDKNDANIAYHNLKSDKCGVKCWWWDSKNMPDTL